MGKKKAKPGVAFTELCPKEVDMKKKETYTGRWVTPQIKHIKCNTYKSSENYHAEVILREQKMNCPECNSRLNIIDSRCNRLNRQRSRRICTCCGFRATTRESFQAAPLRRKRKRKTAHPKVVEKIRKKPELQIHRNEVIWPELT